MEGTALEAQASRLLHVYGTALTRRLPSSGAMLAAKHLPHAYPQSCSISQEMAVELGGWVPVAHDRLRFFRGSLLKPKHPSSKQPASVV